MENLTAADLSQEEPVLIQNKKRRGSISNQVVNMQFLQFISLEGEINVKIAIHSHQDGLFEQEIRELTPIQYALKKLIHMTEEPFKSNVLLSSVEVMLEQKVKHGQFCVRFQFLEKNQVCIHNMFSNEIITQFSSKSIQQ